MKVLCIADTHFVSKEGYFSFLGREYKFGAEFLERVFNREKGNYDIVVLCGDIVDNPEIDCAEKDFIKIIEICEKKANTPFIFVKGNHDIEIRKFLRLTGKTSLPLILGEYIFYPFHDVYREDNTCYRDRDELKKFEEFCNKHKDKKVIALQHNTVYPEIEVEFPSNIDNGREIMDFYTKNRVKLSLSGHHHEGVEPLKYQGIYFLTLPALCESPFSYYIIELGEDIKFEKKSLYIKAGFPVVDFHCHTEFGYCAVDVSSLKNIERAKLFGLDGIVLTEHSGQLYLSADDYWNYRFVEERNLIHKAKKEGKSRMEEFKKALLPFRNNFVKIGLEVECSKYGELTLLPEDREGIDFLLGAVHFLPEEFKVSEKKLKKGFLKFIEYLVKNKVDIIAHPLRYFTGNKLEKPKDIYDDIVNLLKDNGIAAEINFHHNMPDPVFFEKCIENGVKISFGTDAHTLLEVGELSMHVEFLKKLKVKSEISFISF